MANENKQPLNPSDIVVVGATAGTLVFDFMTRQNIKASDEHIDALLKAEGDED
jgi:hypothetical protein